MLARCERSRSTRRAACGRDTLLGMHVFLVHGALYRCVLPTGRGGVPSRNDKVTHLHALARYDHPACHGVGTPPP